MYLIQVVKLKSPLYILSCVVLFSCGPSKPGKDASIKAVATAGNETLDDAAFNEIFVNGGTVKDSNYLAKKTIENWATEALFYQEAMSKLHEDEMMTEREVENYKKTLINYIYQTKLMDANLDTNISSQEIENYYNEHRNNFILKENIIKVNYLKIAVKAQDLNKIKQLLYFNNPKYDEQLKNLCIQRAENFFMNDSTWLFLDDIKKEIPALKDQPDFNLSPGRILQFTDSDYYYYLKVKDVKVKNGLSPINFERQNIKSFIINNRKTRLIKSYKQLLLEKAKANKSFVVY
jgi:hypothetical protein